MTYQWYSGTDATSVTNPISGETSASFTVTSAVEGQYLKVVVTDLDGDTAESDVTDAVYSAELALKNVEAGAAEIREWDAVAGWISKGYNVVIAYFNSPVGDLQPTDVQIRRVSDDQLFSVEKVAMSSDKMSATLTLTNSSSAGASVTGLQAVTDYKLIVTTEDGTASKEFYIPATWSDVTVFSVDTSKNTIKADDWGNAAPGADPGTKFEIPEELGVDLNSLLGETVTIKFDKKNVVSSINKKAGETVIYSAFKEAVKSATNYYLEDVVSETKYNAQTSATTSVPASVEYAFDNADAGYTNYGHTAAGVADNTAGFNNDDTFKYGKLILNDNGTIKAFLHLTKWSGQIMVAETLGDYIIGVNEQEQTLKDYTILSDGQTITVDDIEAGDVVFFNTTYKMAEVYDDFTTGELEAVYDNAGFKFDGKDRDGSSASYFDGTTLKAVTTDYLKALKAEGEDITVYYDRSKTPVFILGETGEVASTSKTILLTAKGDGYTDKKDNIIELKGFDGEDSVTESIKVGNIKTVKLADGSEWKSSLGSISVGAAYTTATTGETLVYSGNATTKIVNLANDFAVGKLVTLTLNDKGDVTGFDIKASVTGNNGNDFFDNKLPANSPFKAGWTTYTDADGVKAAKLNDSTNVWIINKDSSVTAKKVAYSDFDGSVANTVLNKLTFFYNSDKTAVTDVVIDNQDKTALGDDDTGATTSEVVVKDVKYLDGKISGLTVIESGVDTTYSTFGSDDSLKGTFANGDIVKLTVLSDGETVSKIKADSGNGDNDDTVVVNTGNTESIIGGVTTTGNGSLYLYNDKTVGNNYDTTAAQYSYTPLTIGANATICKVEGAGNSVSAISISDLASLSLTNKVVLSAKAKGGKELDTIVVTKTANAAEATMKAVVVTGQGVSATNDQAGELLSKALYDNAVKEKKNCDIAIADYEAAGGKFVTDTSATPDAALNAAVALYTSLKNAIEVDGAKLIVSAPVTTKTVEAATATKTAAAELAKFADPDATDGNTYVTISCTLANGKSKDIKVKLDTRTEETNTHAATATVAGDKVVFEGVIQTAGYSFATDANLFNNTYTATGTNLKGCFIINFV